MTGEAVAFWGVAVVLLAASLGVVLTRNLFHAVLYLAAALVATGVVFLLLDSPFLFAVQLLLYAGGVVTIVVFAIMLTERLVGQTLTQTNRHIVNGAIVSAAVFVAIATYRRGKPDYRYFRSIRLMFLYFANTSCWLSSRSSERHEAPRNVWASIWWPCRSTNHGL